MLQCKRKAFRKTKIDAERSPPRQLWCLINSLSGRGCDASVLGVSADELQKFFNDNVSALRASTSDAASPTFSTVPLGCSFNSFQPLTAEDVMRAVRALPDKQCCSDTLPTRLLKENVRVLAPFLVELLNRSLVHGTVPTGFKAAYITPRLKKPDLDQDDTKSYR